MSEFIEFISPEGFDKLSKAKGMVDEIAASIKSINDFKTSTTPSGADKTIKEINLAYKERANALKLVKQELDNVNNAEKKAEQLKQQQLATNIKIASAKKADIALSEAQRKAMEASLNAEKKASQNAISEIKKRLSTISSLNKQRFTEEEKLRNDADKAALYKHEQELKRVREVIAMRASLNAQQQKEAKQSFNNSQYGASSVIPGMSGKIANEKEAQRATLANEKLSRAYNILAAQHTKAKQTLQDLVAEGRKADQSQSQYNATLRTAQKEFTVLDARIKKADVAVGNFSRNVGNYKSALSGATQLMGAFGIATGLYLAVDIVKNIYETTKQLQSMDLALKMVSGTQAEFAVNQAFVKNLAEQYGIEIKGLTKNFTEFWVASKGKLEAEQIKGIFTSISKSVAVMGLSIEQQDSAFLALQQMMSKGTVQAEELKKQLGNALPGAMKAATMAYQALHPEMKVTEALFMAQMKAGKILSSELLPELAKQFEKLYGIENVKRAETLQAAQERLSNTWVEMVRSMNSSETGGISAFFSLIVSGATEAMKFLVRLNSTKEDLTKSARDKGNSRGAESYKKQLDELVGDKLSDKQRIEIRKQIKNVEEQIKLGYDLDEAGEKNQEKLRRLNQAMGTGSAEDANLTLRTNAYRNIVIQQKKLNELKAETDNYSLLTGGKGGRGMTAIDKDREKANELLGYYEAITRSAINYKEEVRKTPPPVGETETERRKREAAEKKEAKDMEQIRKEAFEAELSNFNKRKELLSDHLSNAQNFNSEELSDFKLGVDKKIRYANQLAIAEIAIAELVHKEKTRIANKDIKDRGLNQEQGRNLLIPIDNELQRTKGDVEQARLKQASGAFKDYFNAIENAIPKDWESRTPAMWTKEQMKQAEEDLEKAEKLRQKAIEDVKNYISSFQIELGHNLGFDETADFFLKMDEDGKTMFDKLDAMADGSKEKQIATFQAIAESAQEMFNFIANASQANFQGEYERLEKQKNIAIGFAGDSDAAKKKIEEDYEKRRKEIAVREFKAKQKIAMVNIAIDTAQAIAATIGKTGFAGIPLAVIVGALGAVQLAIVASQKVPQYWTGTDNAEAGAAWTQERGREIITDNKGNIKDFGSNKGARLTMMEKGDKVFNAEDTRRMMFDSDLNGLMMDNGIASPKVIVNAGVTPAQMREIMQDTLGGQTKQNISFDKNGFGTYVSKNGNITRRSEDRGNGIGLTL